MQRFATHFGSKPVVYAAIWADLQRTENEDAKVDVVNDRTKIEHLLIATHFFKCHSKENEAEAIFKLSDRSIRKWVWFYAARLQALKSEKIAFPSRWSPDDTQPESTFILLVDRVHCRMHEPMHGTCSKNPKCCSHKFKQAGLDYEIALSIFENKCVWVNGPFPAGKNDISVFRSLDGLKEKMTTVANGKLGIADLGYRGEAATLTTPNSHDDSAVREFKSRVLARHEKFNGQVKNFGCLSERFRHCIVKHQMCFDSIVVICQHQLENGSPLNVV